MPKLAIYLTHRTVPAWQMTPAQAARLERELPGTTVALCPDQAAFLGALPTAEVAIVWHFRPEWLALAPRLRLLATPAAGRDYFQPPSRPGLELSYGSFHGQLIGETVLGMLLAATRGILASQARQLAGDPWPRAAVGATMRPLRRSHLTILGFGAIGQWVGRLAKPFGVRITGVRRSAAAPPSWFEPGDRLLSAAQLDAVLPETDHLLLALPGDTESDHLLDERRLRLLPPSAWVYNVGRGNAIDEAALAAALATGRLAGACLDVFAEEPLPATSPLRQAPNLLVMPHAAAISPNYFDLFIDEFVDRHRIQFSHRFGGRANFSRNSRV